MSLDYKLTNIDNWRGACLDEKGNLNDEAEFIIFATMAVGLGVITEKNYMEFSLRCRLMAGFAEYDTHIKTWRSFTPERVHRFIGLRTNVSNETRGGWLKRMLEGTIRTDNYNEARRLEKLEKEST